VDIIPFKKPAQWRQEIELDGALFILRFKWNALNEFWTMDVLDGDENPIVYGVKVVVNWNLLEQYSKTEKPAGDILCQNIVGGFDKIQRYDMNRVAELVYYAQGELEALEV
jgi:hypothetical protein